MSRITTLALICVVFLVSLSPSLPSNAQENNYSLTDQEMNNLRSFAQLYGYVRFFHPSDETMQADWANFALSGTAAVLEAQSSPELAKILQDIFTPLAPTIQVFLTDEGAPPISEEITRRDNYVIWQVHRGFGLGGNLQSPYSSFRRSYQVIGAELGEDVPDPAYPPNYDLENGISVRVPHSLYTSEYNNVERYHGAKPAVSFENKSDRLGTVIIIWSILEHFFPYWDVTPTDWDAVLTTSLSDAAQAYDVQSMHLVLSAMAVALHDGHAHVTPPSQNEEPRLFVPFTVTYIDGEYIVSDSEVEEVPVGSTVMAMNNRLIEEIMAENQQLRISAATTQFQHAYDYILFNYFFPWTNTLEIQLRMPNDKIRMVIVPRTMTGSEIVTLAQNLRPEAVTELENGIWYIDLSRWDNVNFNLNKNVLAQAEGIIFDMRGYPSGVPSSILGHFTDTELSTAQFLTPYITQPHLTDVEYLNGAWAIPPASPHFTDNVVFLTNGEAISYAETLMGIVEHYELGEIVGIPTAGTNGNVTLYELPGGFTFTWTGMLVLKQDGSQHHGIGIQPTIPVTQTVDDLIRGEDTQLNAALATIHANR